MVKCIWLHDVEVGLSNNKSADEMKNIKVRIEVNDDCTRKLLKPY